jgi:hypothetical protein
LTAIDIGITMAECDGTTGSPFIGRPEHTFEVWSNVKPSHAEEYHLGFRTRRIPHRLFWPRGDKYRFIGLNEPFRHTRIRIAPFDIICANNGDGQMLVAVRLPGGMTTCCMSILQEGKAPIEVGSHVRREEAIYYCMAVISPLQSVHIEESKGDQ